MKSGFMAGWGSLFYMMVNNQHYFWLFTTTSVDYEICFNEREMKFLFYIVETCPVSGVLRYRGCVKLRRARTGGTVRKLLPVDEQISHMRMRDALRLRESLKSQGQDGSFLEFGDFRRYSEKRVQRGRRRVFRAEPGKFFMVAKRD